MQNLLKEAKLMKLGLVSFLSFHLSTVRCRVYCFRNGILGNVENVFICCWSLCSSSLPNWHFWDHWTVGILCMCTLQPLCRLSQSNILDYTRVHLGQKCFIYNKDCIDSDRWYSIFCQYSVCDTNCYQHVCLCAQGSVMCKSNVLKAQSCAN